MVFLIVWCLYLEGIGGIATEITLHWIEHNKEDVLAPYTVIIRDRRVSSLVRVAVVCFPFRRRSENGRWVCLSPVFACLILLLPVCTVSVYVTDRTVKPTYLDSNEQNKRLRVLRSSLRVQ